MAPLQKAVPARALVPAWTLLARDSMVSSECQVQIAHHLDLCELLGYPKRTQQDFLPLYTLPVPDWRTSPAGCDRCDAGNSRGRFRRRVADRYPCTRWRSWRHSARWTRWHRRWSARRRGCRRFGPKECSCPRVFCAQRPVACANRGKSGCGFFGLVLSVRLVCLAMRHLSTEWTGW